MSLKISVFLLLAAILCLFQQSLGATTNLSSVELQDRLCVLDTQYCTELDLPGVDDEGFEVDGEEGDEDQFGNTIEKDSEGQNELKEDEDEDEDYDYDLDLSEEHNDVEGRARRTSRRRGRKGRKGRKTRRGVRKNRRTRRKPKRNNRKRRNNRRTRRKNNRG